MCAPRTCLPPAPKKNRLALTRSLCALRAHVCPKKIGPQQFKKIGCLPPHNQSLPPSCPPPHFLNPGAATGGIEKVYLFILRWLALRRTGFSSEKNCYSFLSSSEKNLNDSTFWTGWLSVVRSDDKWWQTNSETNSWKECVITVMPPNMHTHKIVHPSAIYYQNVNVIRKYIIVQSH